MGMALERGRDDDVDGPYTAWNDILELAECYGWNPTRTGPPRRTTADEWCGTYYTMPGTPQVLAEALSRFLAGEPPSTRTGSRLDYGWER
ncbi:MAG: hypothetical protein ABI353_18085 [Isosphaeraceae bacterium]